MRWFLCILILSLGACQAKNEDSATESVDYVVDEIPEDIKIPSALWDQIAGPMKAKDPNADEETSNQASILFSPVTVVLTEHNPQVLDHKQIRIVLPRGGGRIDLAQYRGANPGSFYVRFEYPEWQDVQELNSYFVSRAKKRKLDEEIYGVGCNKFLEITTTLKSTPSPHGLKVNTTRDRHSTVLGGHFIFAAKKDKQTFLSQVTFVDSKNKHFFCDEIKVL